VSVRVRGMQCAVAPAKRRAPLRLVRHRGNRVLRTCPYSEYGTSTVIPSFATVVSGNTVRASVTSSSALSE